jgi:hypothetical protein
VIDAAGRHASQTIGSGATTTYEYLGTSDQISSECAGGVVTYSAIDAIGDRLSQGTGSSSRTPKGSTEDNNLNLLVLD